MNDSTPFSLEPVSTGVPGLDEVLGGGLHRHGMYMVEGPPGAGKTILSAQVSFHLAREGRKVLYLTLIAESHGKLIQHMSQLDFFVDGLISARLMFMNGYQELKNGGLNGLLQAIAGALAEHRPALIVIDGYRSVHTLSRGDDTAVAEFVHELSTLTSTIKCMCLLLVPKDGQSNQHMWAVKTLMDGVLCLHHEVVGMRSIRELEVQKMRAAAHMHGKHVFSISQAGIIVHPRLEARSSMDPIAPPEFGQRLQFGIHELDDMLHGGLFSGSMTCLFGPPGSGKTLLALKFLDEGAAAGEPALYFGFYEGPPRLLAKAERIGMRLCEAQTAGTMHVLWQPALEYTLDMLADRLLDTVRRHGIRRLVIDGLEGFQQSAVRPERMGMFLTALAHELRSLQVATIVTHETAPFTWQPQPSLMSTSTTVDNSLLLRYLPHGAGMRRLISVWKLRESGHDCEAHEFVIGARGIEVAPDSRSASQILAEQKA